MSANSVRWDGLDELRDELRRLPAELAGEASAIVLRAATAAKEEIIAAYPRRTGNLRTHVSVSKQAAGPYGAGAIVKNTAKHAYIFENGTEARHTALGADRGSMPPGHVFIPIAMRRRRAMYEQLKALLETHGAKVTGHV